MNDTTFKLRVPTKDLEMWKHAAKKVNLPLSEWIRKQCSMEFFNEAVSKTREHFEETVQPVRKNSDRAVLEHGAISEGDGLAANPVATAHESTCGPQKWLPNKKTCKHGVERGYHCWQCGGVADV